MITRLLAGLAILAALLVVYVPHVRHATFVFEDDRSLYQGAVATPLSWATITTGRGITKQSWRVIRTPSSAHALNLALHALNALLAGLLFWHIRRDRWVACGMAGIMALHPLTIETVAYATSRAELIAAVGALIAVYGALCRWPVGLAVAVAGIWIAWLGKETGAIVLLLIPLVLWYRHDQRLEYALWMIGGTLVITSALWWPYAVTLPPLGETPTARVDPLSWGLIQASAVWRLVLLSVWPGWLSVTPDIPPSLLLGLVSAVFLVACLECAWRVRHRAPLFTAGVLWCAVVAAPRFLVRTPLSPFNEHQWYLAMPGVACVLLSMIEIAAAWVAAQWGRRLCPA